VAAKILLLIREQGQYKLGGADAGIDGAEMHDLRCMLEDHFEHYANDINQHLHSLIMAFWQCFNIAKYCITHKSCFVLQKNSADSLNYSEKVLVC
jgi:hypothetical protein